MGLLIDGKWQDSWYDTDKTDGAFERQESDFRNWVTADGSAGPRRTDITSTSATPAPGRTAP